MFWLIPCMANFVVCVCVCVWMGVDSSPLSLSPVCLHSSQLISVWLIPEQGLKITPRKHTAPPTPRCERASERDAKLMSVINFMGLQLIH